MASKLKDMDLPELKAFLLHRSAPSTPEAGRARSNKRWAQQLPAICTSLQMVSLVPRQKLCGGLGTKLTDSSALQSNTPSSTNCRTRFVNGRKQLAK